MNFPKKTHITSIVTDAIKVAWPIMAGYIVLGLPCGLLSKAAGLGVVHVFLFSILFYSGAGQYMIPNMYLAGADPLSIILSVSLVNTRQVLYSASLSRFCENARKRLLFIFGATVTDESFGVNLAKLQGDDWGIKRSAAVNIFSCLTWALSNVVGVLIGSLISVPTAIASFAMTSIFICLFCMQKITLPNMVAGFAAALGVIACKLLGLTNPAILIGAVFGVMVGFICSCLQRRAGHARCAGNAEDAEVDACISAKDTKADATVDADDGAGVDTKADAIVGADADANVDTKVEAT